MTSQQAATPRGTGEDISVRAEDVVRRFGDRVVLDHLRLELAASEFAVLLGPSGCGKTTLLLMEFPVSRYLTRSARVIAIAALLPVAAACAASGASRDPGPSGPASAWSTITFTIGQQASGIVTLVNDSGVLTNTPYKVRWALFSYGPPLVAAEDAGQVDIGDVGDIPPINGAAKDTGFRVVAAEEPVTSAEAGDYILVPKGSPIKALADLRGKSVAVPIGSSANGFLLNAIESVGLSPKTVNFVNLAPGPGAAAFDTGKVDAWAIWQPQVSIEQQKGARILIAGHPPLDYDTGFYVASLKDLQNPVRRAALTDLLQRLARAYQWGDDHIAAWEQAVERETQVSPQIAAIEVPNGLIKVRYVTPALVGSEQTLANEFYATGQIAKKVTASQIVDNLLSPSFTTK
jgi:sulfonate transport system substrate-binding protein